MKITIICLLFFLQALVNEIAGAGRFRGVNHAGAEYTCLKGGGVFEGPADQNSINAMKRWKINAVRLPLNSDCWLGINGHAGGAANYKKQVSDYVNLLIKNGISVILALMWSDGANTSGLPTSSFCRDSAANCLKPMPDAQYAPEFWAQVANWFKYNSNSIIFDLFNEPFPDRVGRKSLNEVWSCWKNGGKACYWITYPCTGMQHLVNIVRASGAKNSIMVSGVNFSNDMNGWLQYAPSDPLNRIIASFHVYKNNYFNSISQFANTIKGIRARHEVIVGEFGQGDCAHYWVDPLMRWLDAEGISYLAWTWNLWGCNGNNGLISDWSGTPTAYGDGIKNHYLSL